MKLKLLLLLLPFLVMACKSKSESETGSDNKISQDTVIVEDMVPVFPKDSIHDRIAQYLSGTNLFFDDDEKNISSDAWNEYSNTISTNWATIDEKRLDPMRRWQTEYFANQMNDTMQLFYPFSGPDFLHAVVLFPNANDYVFMANEKIGKVPNFEAMSKSQHISYLHNVDFFLRDIYKRSYFITGNMWDDIGGEKVEGVLPIFYVFLSKTGHEIMDVERVNVSADGTLSVYPDSVEVSNNIYSGVRFYFRKAEGARIKTLTYFYCDISDDGFAKHTELETYLNNLRKSNGFVKSASYLMHYNTFNTIRNIVLDKVEVLFQDDTGIPFKYFDKDKYEFVLFGKYEKPISDFSENLTQKDFADAYKNGEYEVLELPFSLGYHWNSTRQNYMLAKKSNKLVAE
jgi:hypothetical protein